MSKAVRLLCMAGILVPVFSACSAGVSDVQDAAVRGDCDTLAAQLSRKEPWIVEDAAMWLGRAGCTQAAAPLLAVLGNGDLDERVRAAAGSALARLGKVEAAPLLVEELSRASLPEVRYQLVTALGRLCTPQTVGALEAAATDGDIYVSRAARKGISRCAGTKSGGAAP